MGGIHSCWRGVWVGGLELSGVWGWFLPALFPLWAEAGLAVLSGSPSAGHGFCLSGEPLAPKIDPVQTFLVPLPCHPSQKLPSSRWLEGVLPWETLPGLSTPTRAC